MADALPIYQIRGKLYFRDERLGEYRNVKNPSDTLGIDIPNSWLQKPTLPYPGTEPSMVSQAVCGAFRSAIKDETRAEKEYVDLGRMLGFEKLSGESAIVAGIMADERKHAQLLRQMANKLRCKV